MYLIDFTAVDDIDGLVDLRPLSTTGQRIAAIPFTCDT